MIPIIHCVLRYFIGAPWAVTAHDSAAFTRTIVMFGTI
jgi:hypothetical protein